MTPKLTILNDWQIKTSIGMYGSTDLATRTMWVPTGTSPMAQAIRLHEVYHALTSAPWTEVPQEHAQAYSWLDDARIDYLVHDAGGDYRKGICELREEDITKWLAWADNKNKRQQIKAALIGRGIHMPKIVKDKDDMMWIAITLGNLSNKKITHNGLLALASQLDSRYPA